MALAFQGMLERFGLTEKIHAVNADSATANDNQTTKLDALPNSFEKENRVRCFNHTLQLSAKSLLAPFNPAISQKATQDDEMLEDGDDDQLLPEDDMGGDDEDDSEGDVEDNDDENDGINELEELSENERAQVLENTVEVHETVTKVSHHGPENVRIY
jgi:hypothetical protein